MSDIEQKPKPHPGPVYTAALYPGLAQIARDHGYALAVHGSLATDLDVIAVPWTDTSSDPEIVVASILETFAVTQIPGNPGIMKHGRRVWTLGVGFGKCYIDLSFMPRTQDLPSNPVNVEFVLPQQTPEEKTAPVQGHPVGIPWSLHLEAYAAYSKRYGPQTALIDLEGRNCRGGFGTEELDVFIPGWRDRISVISRLRQENVELRELVLSLGKLKNKEKEDGGQEVLC